MSLEKNVLKSFRIRIEADELCLRDLAQKLAKLCPREFVALIQSWEKEGLSKLPPWKDIVDYPKCLSAYSYDATGKLPNILCQLPAGHDRMHYDFLSQRSWDWSWGHHREEDSVEMMGVSR